MPVLFAVRQPDTIGFQLPKQRCLGSPMDVGVHGFCRRSSIAAAQLVLVLDQTVEEICHIRQVIITQVGVDDDPLARRFARPPAATRPRRGHFHAAAAAEAYAEEAGHRSVLGHPPRPPSLLRPGRARSLEPLHALRHTRRLADPVGPAGPSAAVQAGLKVLPRRGRSMPRYRPRRHCGRRTASAPHSRTSQRAAKEHFRRRSGPGCGGRGARVRFPFGAGGPVRRGLAGGRGHAGEEARRHFCPLPRTCWSYKANLLNEISNRFAFLPLANLLEIEIPMKRPLSSIHHNQGHNSCHL